MADPYYANVALLLPMNGADNGTVFTDWSPTPKTITRYGDAKTVTAQSKYYGSSGYFDGTGDYLKADYHSSMEVGTGQFTIGAWFYPVNLTNRTVFNRSSGTYGVTREHSLYFTSATNIALYYGIRGTNQVTRNFTVSSISLNAWHYLEFCRDSGGVMRASVDGTFSANTYTDATNLSGGGVLPAYVGAFYEGSNPFYGYLQDVILYNGVAIHTTTFTPPDRKLSSVSGTILDTTGAPCARTVHLYDNATGSKVATTTSDASTGAYAAYCGPNEVFRVVMADEPTLYNHIIDRVIPG